MKDVEEQEDPLEKWSEMVQSGSVGDATILYALEGLIHRQAIQGEGTPDEVTCDSDIDPSVIILGETRQVIRGHYNLNE